MFGGDEDGADSSCIGDGTLGRSSLTNLLTGGWLALDEKATGVNGVITSLHSIRNERTAEKLIIGGVDDGGITVWELSLVIKPHSC